MIKITLVLFLAAIHSVSALAAISQPPAPSAVAQSSAVSQLKPPPICWIIPISCS